MSRNRDQLLEQLEGLGTSLTAVLDRLGQIELEIAASKSDASRQIAAIREFLNSPEIAALAGPDPSAGADVSRANEAIQKLSVGETQEQILEIFLEEVNGFSDRAILFLKRGEAYLPWKSLGLDSASIDSLELPEDDPIQRSARQQRVIYRTDNLEEAFPWLTRLGPVPATAVCIPLIFEDTAPVVLFADASHGIELDSLELLVHLAVLVLKNHYLTVCLQGTAGGAGADAAAPLAAIGELEEPPAPPPFPDEDIEELLAEEESSEVVEELTPPEMELEDSAEELAAAAFADEDVDDSSTEVEELAVDLDLEEEREELEAVSQVGFEEEAGESHPETGSWSGLLEGEEDRTTLDEPALEEDFETGALDDQESDEVPSLEALLRSENAGIETPVEIADDEDVLTFEAGTLEEELELDEELEEVAEEPAVAPPAEEAPPEPPPPPAVEPEPALDPETERKHQEARRFARLLVSEIKLYHEDAVSDGRKNGDLYDRLMRDIDRSRDMYERRADAVVKRSQDYFHGELIRILAEGDEDRMGSDYPGPRLSETG